MNTFDDTADARSSDPQQTRGVTAGARAFRSVAFVGDLCLAGDEIAAALEVNKPDLWAELRRVFGDDTAIVANIECAFTEERVGRPFKWANLRASPQLGWALDRLATGILGNNHVGDFGVQGVIDTQNLLASKAIATAGYGLSVSDAMRPALLDVNGHRVGIVSLCCPTTNSENLATHWTPGVAPLGMKTLERAIGEAKPTCDAVVAYLHWGCERVHDPAPDQLRLARHAIDCGADAVIGCHSHTVQSYEQYRGRWIFYGLGNYLFHRGSAQQVLNNGRIVGVPLILNGSQRESLVVHFAVTGDRGAGRLELRHIQAMRFGGDWIPRPIGLEALTCDVEASNARLQKYAERHLPRPVDMTEPVFRAKLRNGILAYWYSVETIAVPPARSMPTRVLRRLWRAARGH